MSRSSGRTRNHTPLWKGLTGAVITGLFTIAVALIMKCPGGAPPNGGTQASGTGSIAPRGDVKTGTTKSEVTGDRNVTVVGDGNTVNVSPPLSKARSLEPVATSRNPAQSTKPPQSRPRPPTPEGPRIEQKMENSPGGIQVGGDLNIAPPRRTLSRSSAESLVQSLRTSRGVRVFILYSGDGEPYRFANEVCSVFKEADWNAPPFPTAVLPPLTKTTIIVPASAPEQIVESLTPLLAHMGPDARLVRPNSAEGIVRIEIAPLP